MQQDVPFSPSCSKQPSVGKEWERKRDTTRLGGWREGQGNGLVATQILSVATSGILQMDDQNSPMAGAVSGDFFGCTRFCPEKLLRNPT